VRFRVGASGESAIRIEIPEAAECRVRTVDSRTGKTAPIHDLWWNPARAEGLTGGSLQSVEASPEPGTFSFRAPVGRIELAPVDDEWEESRDFEIRSGSNEITFPVSRRCAIRVILKEGSAIVEGGEDFEFAVTCIEGDGETQGGGSDGKSRWVYLSGPGRYELKFHGLKGFDEIPPKVVTVGEGETTEVIVELRRRE
jgi:hypothetical protein